MPEQKPPPKLGPLSRFLHRVVHLLQRLPLISLRFGVVVLLILSGFLFLSVLFVALPSATIRVTPRETIISRTANVLFLSSDADPSALRSDGGLLGSPVQGKLTLPLLRQTVTVSQSFTFDQISKKFTGRNARTRLMIHNESSEPYSLRPRTRLVNQAGMVFRLVAPTEVPGKTLLSPGTVEAEAIADSEDLYGQIVGERGNVPEGLKWEFPGLPSEERGLLSARNPFAATGGTTAFTRELREEDLVLAERILRQRLREAADVLLQERIARLRQQTGHDVVILPFEELMEEKLFDVVLPREFLLREIQSVPIEGKFTLTALAYDRTALLRLLEGGVREHVERGKLLREESLTENGLLVSVISYDDDLWWVKTTVELTARERYNLNPVTPTGIAFGEKVREAVRGSRKSDAQKIIQNFPEVGRVQIRLWPPWKRRLPELPGQIVVEENAAGR